MELLDAEGTTNDRRTEYQFGPGATASYAGHHTTQTRQEVRQGLAAGGALQESTTQSYNRQNRLAQVAIDSDGNGTTNTTLVYEYDPTGIRSSETKNGDQRHYLVDAHNPTGYAQVLAELTAALAVLRTFTLGQDVLAQATVGEPAVQLLYDGHGSTRALTDSSGQVVVGQEYSYSAHGTPVGNTLATAHTPLQYSGEWTSADSGKQYLRARYYSPNIGRFDRLDPFAGSMQDALSFHKYAYVYGDPIQGVDPTGLQFGLAGFSVNFSISANVRSLNTAAVGFAKGSLIGGGAGGVTGFFDGYTENGSFADGIAGAIDGLLGGALTGGVIGAGGALFAPGIAGLAPATKLNILRHLMVLNAGATAYSVYESESVLQGLYRGTIGLIGLAANLRAIQLGKGLSLYEEGIVENGRWKGILASVDETGSMVFDVSTAGSSLKGSGTQLFNRAIQAIGFRVRKIRGAWHSQEPGNENKNLGVVNDAIRAGMPLDEAIKRTWTADRAREWGFKYATVIDKAPSDAGDGTWKSLIVEFNRGE